MRLIKLSSSKDVVDYLVKIIGDKLMKNEKVFWLIPGGSAMDIAVKAAYELELSMDLSDLSISLTDERYGHVGHSDSNWRQLEDKNFSAKGATLFPVLDGSSLDETAEHYSSLLKNELGRSNYSIALAGMGPDGHIFGIKPGSPSVYSTNEVIGYKWDDFERLTPTAKFLKNLDEIIIFATGNEKHTQIDNLRLDLPAEKQPAQLLKNHPNVIFFNDYISEEL